MRDAAIRARTAQGARVHGARAISGFDQVAFKVRAGAVFLEESSR